MREGLTVPQGPDTTLTADWGSQDLELQDGGPLLVEEGDLVRWLSAQFQTYPGCSAVSVVQVIRLDAPDSEGCNWSRTLFLDSAGASPVDYGPAYAAIVDAGRKAFNLRPADGPASLADGVASAGPAGQETDPIER